MAPAASTPPPPPPVPMPLKVAYCALNICSACAIVFANKVVMSTYKFKFVTTLTLIHTIFTYVGMLVLSRVGFFTKKELPAMAVAPLAFGYVGYVILNNLSLNLNTVGFYQIMKIMITPMIMVLEFFMFGKRPTPVVCMSVAVVCIGVAAATVTDHVAVSNMMGLVVAVASILVTSLYQIWAGSKQKELHSNSSQLLMAYTPQALVMLLVMVPAVDPIGRPGGEDPHTVLGYPYSASASAAIIVSACLGIVVTLSTFLVIGATSSLTFNVVGHLKTVFILSGGVLLFGEHMPLGRFLGICVTMCGIIWYSWITMQAAAPSKGAVSMDKALDKARRDAESGEATPLLQPGGGEQQAPSEQQGSNGSYVGGASKTGSRTTPPASPRYAPKAGTADGGGAASAR